MDFNWSILGWIAGLIFVYIFGLFEGRGQGYKKRKAEQEQENREQPSSLPARSETITVDDPGLLRIKNENGSFVLDLEGRRVNPISMSSDQRKRLIDMLNIMRPWLEGRSVAAPAQTVQSPAPTLPARPTTVDERLDALGSPAPQSKPAAPPPVSPPARQTSQTPAARPSSLPKEDRPISPANSIVGQIDTILQERLAGTPLEERGVFLSQSPEGGVSVYIGLTRYSGLDDVPDAEVKAAIRSAIAEWENKYTPGL